MSRAYTGVERRGVAGHFSAGIDISENKYEAEIPEPVKAALHVEPWMLRGGLAVVAVALCWSLKPFGLSRGDGGRRGIVAGGDHSGDRDEATLGDAARIAWAARWEQCWEFSRRCW